MKDTVANHLVRYLERRGSATFSAVRPHQHRRLSAMARARLEFINVRHEQVAAHCCGWLRACDGQGICAAHTLGPGLTNAATGVANAALDCIPMVVIAGDVLRTTSASTRIRK
jgi:acetolactate synthase-1/2/3 large subunit